MTDKLSSHTWFLIFYDLSLDVIRPLLPSMGLNRVEDPVFTQSLQLLLEPFKRFPADQRDEDQLIQDTFQMAKQQNPGYEIHLSEWGQIIYPSQTRHQQDIFRWRAAIMRGARRPTDVSNPVPVLVDRTRRFLAGLAPIRISELEVSSEWDKTYCLEREEEGISPFEWVEAAIANYRFLTSWNLAAREVGNPEEFDRVYHWAQREADLLRFPKGSLGRPEEQLALPASLF